MITYKDLTEARDLIFDDLDCFFNGIEAVLSQAGLPYFTLDPVYKLVNKRFSDLEDKLELNLKDKKSFTVEIVHE